MCIVFADTVVDWRWCYEDKRVHWPGDFLDYRIQGEDIVEGYALEFEVGGE